MEGRHLLFLTDENTKVQRSSLTPPKFHGEFATEQVH